MVMRENFRMMLFVSGSSDSVDVVPFTEFGDNRREDEVGR
jgi:hypothetical protein